LAIPIAEAATLIGIGKTTMWGLIRDGRVRPINIGRKRLVIYASLEALLAQRIAA